MDGATARNRYGASPRSVGVIPTSRTMPTISSHGCGFAGSGEAKRTRFPTGLAPSVNRRANASLTMTVALPAARSPSWKSRPATSGIRNVSKNPGPIDVVQRFSIGTGAASRRHLDFGPAHRDAHARQPVGKRDGGHTGLLRNAPLELTIDPIDPRGERSTADASSGGVDVAIQGDARRQVLLRGNRSRIWRSRKDSCAMPPPAECR